MASDGAGSKKQDSSGEESSKSLVFPAVLSLRGLLLHEAGLGFWSDWAKPRQQSHRVWARANLGLPVKLERMPAILGVDFGREFFRGARCPGKTRPKNRGKNSPSKFAEKLAGHFPKLRQTKTKFHPKSALQSLGLNKSAAKGCVASTKGTQEGTEQKTSNATPTSSRDGRVPPKVTLLERLSK